MYEGRHNTAELWGASCPHCGGTTSGVPRDAHERLVASAETRGSATYEAVVEKLSSELEARDVQLALMQRRMVALSLLWRASVILVALERFWRTMFTRRPKP